MSDLIDRQTAIRWVKTECNPYGLPTLDYESGIKVIKHLERMPSAQPEVIRCKDCLVHGVCRFEQGLGLDGYCSQAERRTDE